jgi:glutamine cyclotransferase
MTKSAIIRYFNAIWGILVAIFGFFSKNLEPVKPEGFEILSNYTYIVDDAVYCGQGLANDGTYLYSSGAISSLYMTCLAKIDMNTGEFLLKKMSAVPEEFIKKGYDHIGDISYYNGFIYAPVEDLPEEFPLVLLYDAETLEYTGTYYELDPTYLPDGIPWCTVDAENGYLYTSPFHDADNIVAFNLSDLSFSHLIPLSEQITRVQGGDFVDGKLYVNLDTSGQYREVKAIDVNTGEVSLVASRDMEGINIETEGLTISKDAEGNMIFHITDYDRLYTVYLRQYKFVG